MDFKKLITFGQSNASSTGAVQQGTPPVGGTPQAPTQFGTQAYVPANKQLEPKNNNSVPNDPAKPGDPAKPNGEQGSQLDAFKDVFTVKTDDKGQPIQTTDPLSAPLLTMDPKKLAEAASKMNLVGTVDPELMKQALAGDAAALTKLLNQGAQNAFLASATATVGVVEEAFRKNNQRYDAALPDRIRDHTLRNAKSSNPVLNHPAAAVLIDSTKTAIAAANPHLSAEAVQQQAEGYVLALHADLNTATVTATSKSKEADKSSNFSSFLHE